ncbi:hypothetical protein AGMMS49938_03660 [Fibrobacterales bacterium]|nr:hypothetical protein AGMMS49938_03660 [Fibrobacterales bacterium]
MSNINVTVRHLDEPSSKFQAVIQDEIGKLENHFHTVTEFSVVVEGISKVVNNVEHTRSVEIIAAVPGHKLSANAEAENFGKALDEAISKIKVQLAKHHEKTNDHKSVPTAEVAG